MRLGGPVFAKFESPAEWVNAVQKAGYRAAYCPLDEKASNEQLLAYKKAAKDADIVIAEVGAWSNPLSPDEKTRQEAIEKCKRKLELADKIGARCCVNIAGSRGKKWDGPSPLDLTAETFAMIVATVREIIDAVKPAHSFYTLEPMPWMYPDSPDSYLDLIKAIDRKEFGVHFDPVNIINSPQRYFHNADFIKECFKKLGRFIRSCHAKDILLAEKLTVHLDEVLPGMGYLDYKTYISEVNKLDKDIPLMLEHLPDEQSYKLAGDYVRKVMNNL
ncbi:sugar phosphate isomerase/epimerase [candidate division KSB1 bacterium]|nr:sugar phosphate isomerase/epimerase [candidate division KSB1 bacterium]